MHQGVGVEHSTIYGFFSFSLSFWSVVSFDYHTCLVILLPTLSFDDSLIVLKLCSLNPMATKLTYFKFHKVVFEVSRILSIARFQGLLNPMLTNCWINLWKFWNWLLQTCTFFKKIHGMCKHCLLVVFHILLWNVYSLIQ